jgi:hypothetical protein
LQVFEGHFFLQNHFIPPTPFAKIRTNLSFNRFVKELIYLKTPLKSFSVFRNLEFRHFWFLLRKNKWILFNLFYKTIGIIRLI